MQSNEAKQLRQSPASGGSRADRQGSLDDLPAGTELMRGQYTIESYLNSGGFGITYCASDSLGRTVVIKECFPTIMCRREGTKIAPRKIDYAVELSKLIEQFVSEAHALAALKHKNILHVHQVFEENDTAYMAIDFIDGPDLMDVIQTEPERLTPEEILRLTRRTLGAIKYIHDKDMLHRDISPDNILIDETGEPVLIDFGAALRSNAVPNRVFSKVKFVKDGYSPQEFYIEGSEQGTYSDIYGFAATIYHAISGAPPIDGQQRLSAVAQGHDDPYVPLAGTTDDYPDGFLEALDTALAIMPGDRLQTADEWLALIPARPTRIVSKRAPTIPTRRTRPTTTTSQQAKTRLLADSLAPIEIVGDAAVPDDEPTPITDPDALPDEEDGIHLTLSVDDDEPVEEPDVYDDVEDETPVDLRALMPAGASNPSRDLAAPSPDALPDEDDAALEIETDLAFEDAPEDNETPDEAPLDALETAIAETTDKDDTSLEKAISRMVTEAIELQPEPEPEAIEDAHVEPVEEPADDDALITLDGIDEARDDVPQTAAVDLAPAATGGQGKWVVGGAVAALLALGAVGGVMMFGGSDAPEVAAPAAPAPDPAPVVAETPAPTSPALAAAPAPDPRPAEPEVAPSIAAGLPSAAVTPDTPPLAFSIADVPAEIAPATDARPLGTLPNIETQPFQADAGNLPTAATGDLAFTPILSAEPPETFAAGPTNISGLDVSTLASAPIVATAGTDLGLETLSVASLGRAALDSAPVTDGALSRPAVQQTAFTQDVFVFDENAPADLPDLASEVIRTGPLDTLENSVAVAGIRPIVDPTPPAPLPRTPVAATQVIGAHWDVAMPFTSEVEQVRNANTARITAVTDADIALRSGAWVAEGTLIFALNGENLRPGVPLSAHLLNDLVVDPDGNTRASVRYRDAASGRLDLGLLTIPVIRDISLADQTRLTYRTIDGRWVVDVASVGVPGLNGLQPGDILIREETTGIGIANEDALRAVYAQLVEGQVADARFLVERAGAERVIRVPLVREANR